jgi:hypothetical protein
MRNGWMSAPRRARAQEYAGDAGVSSAFRRVSRRDADTFCEEPRNWRKEAPFVR